MIFWIFCKAYLVTFTLIVTKRKTSCVCCICLCYTAKTDVNYFSSSFVTSDWAKPSLASATSMAYMQCIINYVKMLDGIQMQKQTVKSYVTSVYVTIKTVSVQQYYAF